MAEFISSRDTVLGIDIGSVSVSIVQLDTEGKILNEFYAFHKGNIHDSLFSAGRIFDLSRIMAIACTDSSTCLNENLVSVYNTQVAIMAAAKHLCREAASILHIGAEKFMLIRFGRDGGYQSAKTNTSCAAGTGSFLDQQAGRLNLSGIEELCDKALRNTDAIPSIASRCAVFANTDIIHAQQRGFPVGAICDSLCKGLADNISSFGDILAENSKENEYFHGPLSLKLSSYPNFKNEESFRFRPEFPKHPVAGFYSYTSGKPVSAVKSILEAIEYLFINKKVEPEIIGVGTTGLGRKFIGKIINADLITDEISSYARAAFELSPLTDTII